MKILWATYYVTACSNWDMKLEIKVETVGSSPNLGPLKIAIIQVITLYDYRLYTTNWEISAVWLAQSSGISA